MEGKGRFLSPASLERGEGRPPFAERAPGAPTVAALGTTERHWQIKEETV